MWKSKRHHRLKKEPSENLECNLNLDDNFNVYCFNSKHAWAAREWLEKKFLKICGQSKLLSFTDVLPLELFSMMSKIGSGSYAEVFALENSNEERIIYKIIPVEHKAGESNVAQEPGSLLSDVLIAKHLSALRSNELENGEHSCENFPRVARLNYVYSESDTLKSKDTSRPASNRLYKYMICEMTDGGCTLASISTLSPKEGLLICAQVLAALAVAETAIKFEHRDLHANNILLSKTDQTSISYKLRRESFEIPVHKWKVTIIDFTFSRATIDGKYPVYSDLTNLEINKLKRDSLYKVYHWQKDLTKCSWDQYNPKSNVVWVEYIIKEVVKRIDKYVQAEAKAGVTSIYSSEDYRVINSWKETIAGYESCFDFAMAAKIID